ncbi:hypothetical protein SCOCK_140093 [Actinacidiphila cocklensis]|uniref:Uncharacterized protein n=1 Tax=Actinacidiphila cocklensis TaxID=887465 RepID=A0A9W4E277_9ACTN|nr:hypothetical protein SCOCK_140093 [Actinacidiphila cocklensis]
MDRSAGLTCRGTAATTLRPSPRPSHGAPPRPVAGPPRPAEGSERGLAHNLLIAPSEVDCGFPVATPVGLCVSARGYGVGVTDLEDMARARVSSGRRVERLVCHPRLPLVAGLGGERPAVHVWSCQAGQLRELGCVGAESDGYGDAVGWERIERTPALAWHPDEPRLLVAGGEYGVVQWTPAGLSAADAVPPAADYRGLACGRAGCHGDRRARPRERRRRAHPRVRAVRPRGDPRCA